MQPRRLRTISKGECQTRRNQAHSSPGMTHILLRLADSHNAKMTAFQDTSKDCPAISQFTRFLNVDPDFRLMPLDADYDSAMIDPRPEDSGAGNAFSNVDTVPDDAFFTKTKYKGAFGQDLWLSGLSWLDESGKLPENEWPQVLCGDISGGGLSLKAANTYLLTCQVCPQNEAPCGPPSLHVLPPRPTHYSRSWPCAALSSASEPWVTRAARSARSRDGLPSAVAVARCRLS